MPTGRASRVSLSDIARAAGVSEMTVSRALRAHPEVSIATRAKVAALAGQMGYAPDPRLSKMMSYLRDARRGAPGENLAFLWLDAQRSEVEQQPYLQLLIDGARERARTLGFGLEFFFLSEPGLTPRRLGRILEARGCHGVILSPLLSSLEFKLELDWDRFATVVVGRGQVGPALHRVSPDHYQGMALAMKELARLGCRRIALCSGSGSLARQDHRWDASFAAHHPLGLAAAAEFMLVGDSITFPAMQRWLRRTRPDAVLFHGVPSTREVIAGLRKIVPGLVVASLDWIPGLWEPTVGGINQRYDVMGINAVDLVTAQVLRNERGLPGNPKLVMGEGNWVPPQIPAD